MVFKKPILIIILILLVLSVGVLGYHYIESMSFIDALYMTVITISTVGFGEVTSLSPAGRLFTIFLIIGGIAVISTGVTIIFSSIIEGTFGEVLRRKRMEKKLEKMNGHFIICGCGAVGHDVIREFIEADMPFVLIEQDQDTIDKLTQEFPDLVFVMDDATQDDVLKTAGIERARGIIATLGHDSDNLFVCLSARALNRDLRIIARVTEIESAGKLRRAGADYVFSPEKIGGVHLAAAALRPTVTSFLDTILKGKYLNLRLDEVIVQNGSRIIGKTLKDTNISQDTGIIISAIKPAEKDELIFNPGPDTVIHEHDVLVVFGSPDQIQALKKVSG
jgi:voltage-gated potassium channel